MRGRYYYDVRFLCLPAAALLRSYLADDKKTVSSSFLMIVMELVFFLAILAAFMLTSFRIQLFRNPPAARVVHGRGVELRFGRAALSVPVTLTLATTLFLPLTSFWPAYLVILLLSPLSDRIHSVFTRYSYEEERLLLLPVLIRETSPPLLLPAAQPGPGRKDAANIFAYLTIISGSVTGFDQWNR